MASLVDLLRRAPGSYESLVAQARIVEWTERAGEALMRHRRSQIPPQRSADPLHGSMVGWGSLEANKERTVRERVWIRPPTHSRVESRGAIAVTDGTWMCGTDGKEHVWKKRMTDHPIDLPHAIEFWKPKYLLGMRLVLVGEVQEADRQCALVQAVWREGPYPDDLDLLLAAGIDELRLAVDLERGVILRWRSFFESEPVAEFLVEHIEFDRSLDDALFRCDSLA